MQFYKFGTQYGVDWGAYAYPNIWERETTTGPDRLVIAPASGHIDLIRKLAAVLPEPFGILYVLLVPRSDAEPGRYQCPSPCSRAELDDFLIRYQDYFERDGRHHVWIHSVPAAATLVYDNHNVLYAYGPLEEFKQVLQQEGLHPGEVRFPSPHNHNYNAEFDAVETDILAYWNWHYFPLAEQDGG